MHRTFRRWLMAVALVLPLLAAVGGSPAQAASSGRPSGMHDPCAAASPGRATCAALVANRPAGVRPDTTPAGFTPTDLRSAYSLPTSATLGVGETVAVITAYDDPDAESDVGAYRSQFGLTACTTANGCFKKVNQTGGTTYPAGESSWSSADSQSLDMISAICPACHLLLVEANSPAISDLGTAENEAVTLGADFVDNLWYTPEAGLGSSETSYDTEYFDHPGVAITAPAGNSQYGVNYPAASQYVTAVGGTTLAKSTSGSRGWTESAEQYTGSGCSAYEPKPTWQTDTGCSDRTLNDTAAVADPSTPVAVYDTPTSGGWTEGSGTDVASAIVAAVYALAGPPAPGTDPASYPYSHPDNVYDITTGSNGTCSPAYLCTAGTGYDGPTGVGTPSGVSAFATPGAKPAAVVGTNGTSWVFTHGTDGSIEAASLPSGSSTWSGLTSLGGSFSGSPGAVAGSGGYLWVGAVGGGNLYVNDLPKGSSTWSGWANLGNPGTSVIGIPAVVQDSTGEVHIFVRNSAGALYTDVLPYGSTTWSGFSSLGGIWPNDVSAEAGSGGYLYVFATGLTTDLYDDELSPSGTWSGWTILGSGTIGVPAAVQDQAGSASGTVRVFVRTTTGPLDEDSVPYHSTTWTGLTSLGGSWQTDPVAYAGSGGTDFVYAIGNTASMYYDKLTSGTWSGWTVMSGSFTGSPGATQNSSENELFGRATGGSLEVSTLPNGSSSWSSFKSIGGPIAGS